MRIDSVNRVVGQYTSVNQLRKTEKQVEIASSDKTELSGDAKLFTGALSAAKQALKDKEAASAKRAQELSASISDGSYDVSADDLAAMLLRF